MKTSLCLIAVLAALSIRAFAQGSLTPPGVPAPTMKSLAQVEPRAPISALPFIISQPGSYYFTTNLTGQAGTNGITIVADNVTIDLNGFTLIGVPGSLDGISVFAPIANHRNLAIQNGSVCNWGVDGVDVSGADNSQIERLRVSQNGAHGLFIGAESLVANCTVQSNGSSGIRAGAGTVVSDCTASANITAGIENYRFNNDATASLIKGCSVHDNLGAGIQGNAVVIDNVCVGNTGVGIFMNSSGGKVEGNYVRQNGTGISTGSSSATNVIVRNVVVFNTNAFSINGSGNIIGPIINAAGVATNNNPNANYSF